MSELERLEQRTKELERQLRYLRVFAKTGTSVLFLGLVCLILGANQRVKTEDPSTKFPARSQANRLGPEIRSDVPTLGKVGAKSTNLYWEDSKGNPVMALGVNEEGMPYLLMKHGQSVSALYADELGLWYKKEGDFDVHSSHSVSEVLVDFKSGDWTKASRLTDYGVHTFQAIGELQYRSYYETSNFGFGIGDSSIWASRKNGSDEHPIWFVLEDKGGRAELHSNELKFSK